MSQLRNILGLGKREAEAISVDVTSKAYRKRLANAVSSGDLEAQDSKAKYLQKLCGELHFDAQKAGAIHEGIWGPLFTNKTLCCYVMHEVFSLNCHNIAQI